MKKLIKKILKEDQREMYLNKIVQVMNNDFPLFKNMEDYGFYDQLSEEELIYVFSGIFGKPVDYYEDGNIYTENGDDIYHENSYGGWEKREYDENGNMTYFHNSKGYWEKIEYDDNGNEIYFENSDGYWVKKEYDERGKLLYKELSNGVIRDYR